jgi:hypothetical protein
VPATAVPSEVAYCTVTGLVLAADNVTTKPLLYWTTSPEPKLLLTTRAPWALKTIPKGATVAADAAPAVTGSSR